MVTRHDVYRAADAIRAGGRAHVTTHTVRAWLTENLGKAGSPNNVAPLLKEWKREREYSPKIELAALPEAVSNRLAAAGVALWQAAQAEAAAVYVRDRERMQQEIGVEREMCSEALALLGGHEAEARLLTERVVALEAELEEARRHLQAVRADVYWERVVHEIWKALPENGALPIQDIEQRLGADLVEECKGHQEEWNHDTLRKKINQRIHHKRLFARAERGRYRRRQPEDDIHVGTGSAA
ncbi:DNA-binding protein [Methylobacterium sp. J-070]|uniref:DNA-binding protein n=1 Tax=Methylobacterium sp. J-070 TaxID=2836650 RepID=UPI001FB91D51|nr:DNA-binding protein [Methylobacterium sp. J-070]MCJ2050077.1 DNA-binding protein [Methylobacterium sp. J-070]